MRNYPSLSEMLRKETTNPNPKQAAAKILQEAPADATNAVLFADRGANHWAVMFVPGDGLETLAKAAGARVVGKPAVACCPIPRPSPPGSSLVDPRHVRR